MASLANDVKELSVNEKAEEDAEQKPAPTESPENAGDAPATQNEEGTAKKKKKKKKKKKRRRQIR